MSLGNDMRGAPFIFAVIAVAACSSAPGSLKTADHRTPLTQGTPSNTETSTTSNQPKTIDGEPGGTATTNTGAGNEDGDDTSSRPVFRDFKGVPLALGANLEIPSITGVRSVTKFGSKLLLAANAPATGVELWISDDTKTVWHMVEDLQPGPALSMPEGFFVKDATTAYFKAATPAEGIELWKTDGTATGTVLVKDIVPGKTNSNPANFVALGNTVFFTVDDGTHRPELWKTDGSSSGTEQVKDGVYLAFTATSSLIRMGSYVYFAANDGTHGNELWRSDGTAAGTTLVADISPGATGSNPMNFAVMNDVLYFAATDADGSELWRSDGTSVGTTRVTDFCPGASCSAQPSDLVTVGTKLFFQCAASQNDGELCTYDGTTIATVKDIYPGATGSYPANITAFGSGVLFTAHEPATGEELWFSDGTAGGTKRLSDITPGSGDAGIQTITVAGNRAYFSAKDGGIYVNYLYSTDGTAVEPAKTPSPDLRSLSSSSNLVVDGASVYFVNAMFQLWKSDGTAEGTTRLLQLGRVPPEIFVSQGNRLYFPAFSDGSYDLWRSDGTATTTVKISGTGTSHLASFPNRILFESQVYLQTTTTSGNYELWRTNGTDTDLMSTTENFDLTSMDFYGNPTYAQAGDKLFLSAKTTASNHALYKVEGGSLSLVADGIAPSYMVPFGSSLVFQGNQTASGTELWISDGTAAGTHQLLDLVAGTNSSYPGPIAALGNKLVFGASGAGNKLWVSDGTPGNATSIASFSTEPGISPQDFYLIGGKLFFTASDPVHGREFWTTDGTADGTTLTKDIFPGSGSGPEGKPGGEDTEAAFGNKLCFGADDGVHGSELWCSDGTEAGTALVKDINPGAAGAGIYGLKVAAGKLWFGADDGTHGFELWSTDGTAAGTHMAADLAPGVSSSFAQVVGAGDDFLYVIVLDGTLRRLYRWDYE